MYDPLLERVVFAAFCLLSLFSLIAIAFTPPPSIPQVYFTVRVDNMEDSFRQFLVEGSKFRSVEGQEVDGALVGIEAMVGAMYLRFDVPRPRVSRGVVYSARVPIVRGLKVSMYNGQVLVNGVITDFAYNFPEE